MNPPSDPQKIISECTSGNEHWTEDSFVGQLHEYQSWNEDAYMKLEWALYQIVDRQYDQKLHSDIFQIFSYTMLSFRTHFDPMDLFSITNISQDDIYETAERFRYVFEGFFSGTMPAPNQFNPPNPYLVSS